MKFGRVQELRFGTGEGSYSRVTEREASDSQITLADYESELVISHFGPDNIHVGNVKSGEGMSSKCLRLYSSGEKIHLNIVFPKPEKTELRLYISSKAGFKPDAGEIWFLFIRDGDIWIGSMPEDSWRAESQLLKEDDSDSIYQESLDEKDSIRVSSLKQRDSYARDRDIAIRRMEQAGFSCEYDPAHKLFISRFSGRRYLEAHHLIPLSLQRKFSGPLDTIHNVFCLCPHCHRAIHHADFDTARNILDTLATKRSEILDDFKMGLPDLFSLYALEDIV